MAAYTLTLSNDPIVILPAELARMVGLQEGAVQLIPGEQSLTVAPPPAPGEYTARWQVMGSALREQAEAYGIELEDRRDEAYWAIVNPLLDDAERWMSSF